MSGQKKKKKEGLSFSATIVKFQGSSLILQSLRSRLCDVQVNVDTELWNLSAGHFTDTDFGAAIALAAPQRYVLSAPQFSVHLGPSQRQYCVVAVIFI